MGQTVEIKTITGTRKGREIKMDVQVTYCGEKGEATLAWIKKADGKPLFGSTGYWSFGGIWATPDVIKTYRGKVLIENINII